MTLTLYHRRHWHRQIVACAIGVLVAFGFATDSQAQTTATAAELPHDTDYAPEPPRPSPIPATAFFMPDLPDSWSRHTAYDGRLFSTSFNLVTILDYNAFSQDEASREQVGEQQDEWDVRTQRLMFRGQLKFSHPVSYLISVEVKGKDHVQEGASSFGFTDFEFSTSLGKLGSLKVGKIKEPFVYEMVGDAANLQQQERALSPFFASRGVGMRLTKPFANDLMTWSVGWFNDWWVADQSFEESGNDFAARLTGVPHLTSEGDRYLHLGASARRTGADGGGLRFRGRPESNVSDYYVDSGSLVADHSTEIALESLWGHGPFLLTAEYAHAWVQTPSTDDPQFWAGSIVASYALTGEHRPYDKKVAYARRISPQHKGGAWEIVGRYSHVDIEDRAATGGIFDRGTIGLNWWATRRWKIGIDYGHVELDRFGITGITHAIHARFQWAY